MADMVGQSDNVVGLFKLPNYSVIAYVVVIAILIPFILLGLIKEIKEKVF